MTDVKKLHELHNRLAPELALKIIGEVKKAGGDPSDVMIVLQSVVTGVMGGIIMMGMTEDRALDAMVERVKERLKVMPRDGEHRRGVDALL